MVDFVLVSRREKSYIASIEIRVPHSPIWICNAKEEGVRWRGRVLGSLVLLTINVPVLAFRTTPAAQNAEAPTRASDGLRLAIDSLYIDDGMLQVDFHADSALTAKLLEGLRRGLTASITYHVQVWQKRWLSEVAAERRIEWKASFDNWERKYIVVGRGERRLTASAATVREKWARQRGLRLVEMNRLQPGKNYYLTIEALLEPVSKENLREIRGWLAGEVRGAASTSANGDTSDTANARADSIARATSAAADSTVEKPGFKLRFLETLMNLIGFGGKKTSLRSANFQIEDNHIVWQP